MGTNSITLVASLNSLIAGLQKNKPKGSFTLSGKAYTAPQLVKICQTILASLAAVPPARGAYRDAVASTNALLAQHHDVLRDLKQQLQLQAGTAVGALTAYGLAPRKPTGTKSPKVKVAAAEKADATRAARHTMGPKQKAQITGATASVTAPQGTVPVVVNANGAVPSGTPPSSTAGH